MFKNNPQLDKRNPEFYGEFWIYLLILMLLVLSVWVCCNSSTSSYFFCKKMLLLFLMGILFLPITIEWQKA